MAPQTFRMHAYGAACLLLAASCRTELIETNPGAVTDTGNVTITCNAAEGNQGLLGYSGDVYVHLGLITSKSRFPDDWRYVKFKWGSRQREARATPDGKNRWTYPVGNVRRFFGVPSDEKILRIAVLFRSGGCVDAYCKVLRSAEGGNVYISVNDQTATRP
jgi:rhodanese-related sulfurtransferase